MVTIPLSTPTAARRTITVASAAGSTPEPRRWTHRSAASIPATNETWEKTIASTVATRPMTGPPLGAAPKAESEVTKAMPKRTPAKARAPNPYAAARRARVLPSSSANWRASAPRLAELCLRIAGEMIGVLGEDATAQAPADAHRAQLSPEPALEIGAHTSTASTARENSRHSLRRVPSSRRPRRVSS